MWRVLCVDDDNKKAEQIVEYFTKWERDNPLGKFDAVVETDFNRAKERLANERFDLVTLDLHGEKDPRPEKSGEGSAAQQGRRVLEDLRNTRFVPVIFYSGYADKIEDLKSPVVQVVKKGENDLEQVRASAKSLFATGLPKLIRHIEDEQRSYVWDTVDKQWSKFGAESDTDELSYLLARRLADRFSRDGIKELLDHKRELARPIEFYIYPPVPGKIKTGFIYDSGDKSQYWIVATPACDFAQNKADFILLVGATLLSADARLGEWQKSKWLPGSAEDKKAEGSYNKLRNLLMNSAGERFFFLPGTFFLSDLVADTQRIRQVTTNELNGMSHICTLDSPYKEEFAHYFSNYYGRLGTPDLEAPVIFERLKK